MYNVIWEVTVKSVNDTLYYKAVISESSDLSKYFKNIKLIDTDITELYKKIHDTTWEIIGTLDHYNKVSDRISISLSMADDMIVSIHNTFKAYKLACMYTGCITAIIITLVIYLIIKYVIVGWFMPDILKPMLNLFIAPFL